MGRMEGRSLKYSVNLYNRDEISGSLSQLQQLPTTKSNNKIKEYRNTNYENTSGVFLFKK